jgi:hypothetical protein
MVRRRRDWAGGRWTDLVIGGREGDLLHYRERINEGLFSCRLRGWAKGSALEVKAAPRHGQIDRQTDRQQDK